MLDLGHSKDKLIELMANMVGSSIINGSHWFIYRNNEYVDAFLENLDYDLKYDNINMSNLLTIKEVGAYRLVIFNKNLFNELSQEIITKVYLQHKDLPRLNQKMDIKLLKKREFKNLIEIIGTLNKSSLNIYLYKQGGLKLNNLIVHNRNDVYADNIFGFYLTEEDLSNLDKSIKDFGKKVASIECKDCIIPELGVLYNIKFEDLQGGEKDE